MNKRFMWGREQVEEFFILLRNSYRDYLMAKELRRMDEFYDMLGSCMGTDGLVVQNFLKKIGRAYRDILLQAETCEEGGKLPERKLRGSARIYALYEEYYQMYYLGAMPSKPEDDLEASGSFQPKTITSRSDGKRKHLPEAVVSKRRRTSVSAPHAQQESLIHVGYEEAADHVDGDSEPDLHSQGAEEELLHSSEENVPAEKPSKRVIVENGETSPRHSHASDAARGSQKHPEEPKSDGIFGTTTTDFQERFLKLMENQNHILATIVDELNLIKHAVLDANGLQTITYVK